MAITLDPARQEVICARVTGTFGSTGDISAQGTYQAITVPVGAIIIGGFFNVTDTTSASVVADIGDGADPNRYGNDINCNATGLTNLTITGKKYTAKDTIDITIAGATPAAAGTWELLIRYVVEGRSAFAQN